MFDQIQDFSVLYFLAGLAIFVLVVVIADKWRYKK